jgi:subtilisin family serine protease
MASTRSKKGKAKSVGPGEPPPPVFSGEENIVPGEILLRLKESTAASITTSIPRGPGRGRAELGPRSLGVDALDRILSKAGVTSITRLHPPASKARVAAAADAALPLSATFRLRYSSTEQAEALAEQLSAIAGVEFAEPNRYRETSITPNDPSFAGQWGLSKIKCPAAWDRTTGSPSVTVAVIDTGIDLDHPELATLIVPGQDLVDLGPNPTAPAGFRFEGDFVGVDADPQDEVGHGTHVAGTIACLSNNATGVAGVTWSCHLMPVRVLARIVNVNDSSDVRGVGSAADIAAGIRWAVDHGARVLNLSLGGSVDTQVERDAIAYAIAHGALVVAAMGNAAQQGNPTSFPGAYPDVIAVGAINQSDQRAPFSQSGPHIDVCAPGVGILSTVWNDGFATMSGTSMATPHVAGVAALILSCNPNLSAAQVADILRQTARPLRDVPADLVPNDRYGFGCVDAEAALLRACPPPIPISRPINCVSRPITTCPSVLQICPSSLVPCAPSRPITTCPSVLQLCPSSLVPCAPSRPITTCPSVVQICPSSPVLCLPTRPFICPQPSQPILCGPSLPLCVPDPGQPFPFNPGLAATGEAGCCSGDPDLAQYDPYATYYGGE